MTHRHLGLLMMALFIGCSGGAGDESVAAPGGDRHAVLQEELRIDGYAADLVPFGYGEGVAVAPNGTIAIAQPQDHRVLFFDAAGEPLGELGRRGKGPGEFQVVGRMGWLGDTLWIADVPQRRLTLVGPDRTLARTLLAPADAAPVPGDRDRIPGFPFASPLALYSDGSMLALLDPGAHTRVPEPFRGHTAIGRIRADGIVERILGRVSLGNSSVVTPRGVAYLPFGNAAVSDVSPDGSRAAVATAFLDGPKAGSFAVTAVDPAGDTLFSRRYAFDSEPIPGSVRDSLAAEGAKRLPPDLASAYREAVGVLSVYPPLADLIVGRDGTVWVQRADRGGQRSYLVLDPQGEPLGALLLPTHSRVAVAERERIWVIERDPNDVDSLVRYGVEWPPVR